MERFIEGLKKFIEQLKVIEMSPESKELLKSLDFEIKQPDVEDKPKAMKSTGIAIICPDEDAYNFLCLKLLGRKSDVKFLEEDCNCVCPGLGIDISSGVGDVKGLLSVGYEIIQFIDYLDGDFKEFMDYFHEVHKNDTMQKTPVPIKDDFIAIKFDFREQAEFIISLTYDNSPEDYVTGYLLRFLDISNPYGNLSNANWVINLERNYSENFNIVTFIDYVTKADLKSQWLEYISNVAISKGFKDKVKYKWEIDDSPRTVAFPFSLDESNLFLSDYNFNHIFDGEWPEIILPEIIKVPLEQEDIKSLDELIVGEIYVLEEIVPGVFNTEWKMIFRFYSQQEDEEGAVNYISSLCSNELRFSDWFVVMDNTTLLRPATLKEKKKLIKREILQENFYYNLK